MLRGLRKASTNWVGKTIMAVVVLFLVGSFVIWGIGDIFTGFGRSTVAKIGSREFTIDQFQALYNQRLQQVSRQLGRPMSPSLAAQYGIDRQIVGQLIAETVLDERARQMGLNLSDADVANAIRKDPNFQGPNGQFDRARFNDILRSASYSEASYVAEQRQVQIRRQLATTVGNNFPVPKVEMAALNQFQNEQRSIEYIRLQAADAGSMTEPTSEELQKYYDDHKILFRAPEFRKITIVPVIPSEMGQWMTVSDEEAKKAYDQDKSRFVTPERRHLKQIVFPNMEEAKAASDKIAQGSSLEAIATERGLKPGDIDLGTVAQASMADQTVAAAAFALKQGETSPPIQGRFGAVLIKVDSVEAEKVHPYEEVAQALKQAIATERAKAQVGEFFDKIEDARAGGATLAEAAEKLKLTSRGIEAIDRSGRDPSGDAIANIPDVQNIITAVFSTEIGTDAEPLQFQGGYIWYSVDNITPAHDRALDEVKDKVTERAKADQVAARLKDKATEMVTKVKSGAPLADVAGGLKVEQAEKITRSGQPSGPITAAVAKAVFDTPKGTAGTSAGTEGTEQFVFRVTEVDVPKVDANAVEIKRAEDGLRTAVGDDLLNAYVAKVQEDVGTTVNQQALMQAMGLSSDQAAN